MNQSIGTFSHSTSTGGTAGAALQAAEVLQDSNPDGMSDSVHNLEPIHIGNEAAPAVSPPRPVQQQVRRPVQRDAAAMANNHENGGNRQLSAALAAGAGATGDNDADTSTDNGDGQDEENEDKPSQPSAKKPRLD